MRLGWNRGEDGVITVYAHTTDGRVSDVADFWLKPLVERFGISRADALDWQQQFAELLVNSHNRLFSRAPTATGSDEWECPLGLSGCKKNCGSYGCGN